MERYLKILKSYKRMPLEMEQKLLNNVRPIKVKKREIIQPEGVINDCLYFVEKGLFHLFGEKDGSRITYRFKKEDEFIICLKEIYTKFSSAGEGVEALEAGLLWEFPGALVSELTEKYMQFLVHFRVIVEADLIAMHQSMRYALPLNEQEKYRAICAAAPELVERVPIPFLANYTGIPEKILRHLHSTKIALNFSTKRRR